PVSTRAGHRPGLRLHRETSGEWAASLAACQRFSKGKPDPFVDSPTVSGHGTYVRCSVSPSRRFERFAIWWTGKDFITNEGDHNYGSPGLDGSFYQSRRRYAELGAVKKLWIEKNVALDAELRLHRIESKTEYSARLVARVAFQIQ